MVGLAGCASAAHRVAQINGPGPANLDAESKRLFGLTNEARARAALPPLQWDPALEAAALGHCRRMAREDTISHQLSGEPGLRGRVAQARVHFDLLNENVAIGTSAVAIHEAWMQSAGHRANLLSTEVDRVGIAVVAEPGRMYAVADYGHVDRVLAGHGVQ